MGTISLRTSIPGPRSKALMARRADAVARGVSAVTLQQNGAANLFATSETIGVNGLANYAQSTANNTLSDWLYVAYQSHSIGTYNLSGAAALTADTEAAL